MGYFLRHADLRHLRLEQFNRYFKCAQSSAARPQMETMENTIGDEDDAVPADVTHRHYDEFAETLQS
eukprot:4062821-Karenia_brevis.AAC.1